MKIVAELDTKEKTLAITMDGKAVDKVVAAQFHQDFFEPEKFHVDITTVEKDEDDDITVVTRVSASEKTEISREKVSSNKPTTEMLSKALYRHRG